MGHAEDAFFIPNRTGEGSTDMAEALAFEQAGRKRGAIHSDKLTVGPLASRMDGSGKEFFPGTTLSTKEHGAIGGSNPLDLFEDGEDFRAFTDNIRKGDAA